VKRTYQFARSMGTIRCPLPDGGSVELPVFAGILKHPGMKELPGLLMNSDVAEKYTREALRVAPWPILREFPADWLRAHIGSSRLRSERQKALVFLLGVDYR
jgi:hypothetical protein